MSRHVPVKRLKGCRVICAERRIDHDKSDKGNTVWKSVSSAIEGCEVVFSGDLVAVTTACGAAFEFSRSSVTVSTPADLRRERAAIAEFRRFMKGKRFEIGYPGRDYFDRLTNKDLNRELSARGVFFLSVAAMAEIMRGGPAKAFGPDGEVLGKIRQDRNVPVHCPKHDPAPLFLDGISKDDRIEAWLSGHGEYVVCRSCGRIGVYSNHASHRLHWIDDPRDLRTRADEWNARIKETSDVDD